MPGRMGGPMKKRFIIMLTALLALCPLVLTGCGPSAEELIRDDLTSQFEEIKAGDEDLLEGIESSAGEDFEDLGIDPKEFASSYLEGFDYTVNDVTVDGDTATANVSITVKSMGDIVNEFQLKFTEYLSTADLSTISGEDELYQQAGQLLMDATASAEPKTVECDFTYTKDEDGVWSADESAETELVNALMS